MKNRVYSNSRYSGYNVRRSVKFNYDSNTDREYDSRKDNWELGDEPLTKTQRQETEDWNRECRLNGW